MNTIMHRSNHRQPPEVDSSGFPACRSTAAPSLVVGQLAEDEFGAADQPLRLA
jgi:hypothetical protein